jgi:hypothetical protein
VAKPAIFSGIVGIGAGTATGAGTAAGGSATVWSGVTGQGGWSGVTGSGGPPPPAPPPPPAAPPLATHGVVPLPVVVGGVRQQQRNQTQAIPRRPVGIGPEMAQNTTAYIQRRISGSEVSGQSPYSEVSGEAMRASLGPDISEQASQRELEGHGHYSPTGYMGNWSELSEDVRRPEMGEDERRMELSGDPRRMELGGNPRMELSGDAVRHEL